MNKYIFSIFSQRQELQMLNKILKHPFKVSENKQDTQTWLKGYRSGWAGYFPHRVFTDLPRDE